MIKYTLAILFATSFGPLMGQRNCNLYLFSGDSLCYRSCLLASAALTYPQGSPQSQLLFDSAILLCPNFDYAYSAKSVPHLKRGNFIVWKELMDAAVELNPVGQLGNRGWCRYQFLRDYHGAIADIERLKGLANSELCCSVNGDYHLEIVRGLCYKAIGDPSSAEMIMEQQLAQPEYVPLYYDYLHLGALKLELGKPNEAILALERQKSINNNLADTYYYLALAYRQIHNKEKWKLNLDLALDHYSQGKFRFDPYTHPMDKIYLSDIQAEYKAQW